MTSATAAWWAKGSQHQSEMLDLMSHRLSKTSEAVRELGQCRSWEDASGVHSKWFNDTLTDYSSQSTKVAAIGADAAQSAWSLASISVRRCAGLPKMGRRQ